MLSACCGFFCLLFCFHAHAMSFPAYFSLPTPTLWVFPPTFLLTRPVFSPQHIDKLPGWVFSPAFHSLRPRYGFSRLLFCSLAQFPLRDISISFRGGFSRSLFTPFAHAMGFHAYFSASTPSFRPGTVRLTSGVGFSARFFASSPTLWGSTPTFLLTRPVSSPRHID